ncbi:hypothetical protein BCEN4_590046 [Burkholderia cenocepacia]|nr:hypothetical protein BCEN4_590046 [Burkholderia cenocepacia]
MHFHAPDLRRAAVPDFQTQEMAAASAQHARAGGTHQPPERVDTQLARMVIDRSPERGRGEDGGARRPASQLDRANAARASRKVCRHGAPHAFSGTR